MIIAITTNGDNVEAPVSGSFTRCHQFIFFDSELGDVSDVVDNPERELPDGGGLEAAEIIVKHDTEILITGEIDPEAGDILGAGGVQFQICTNGSVRSAIDRCLAGELPLAPGPERGIYPGVGSPETPHSHRVPEENDPGREETEEEVVGAEEGCECLMCGYVMPHEAGSPACEFTPCPRCGANMSRFYRAA